MKRTFNLFLILFLLFVATLPLPALALQPTLSNTKMKRITTPEFSTLSVYSNISLELVQGDYPGYVEIEEIGEKDSAYVTWTDNELTLSPTVSRVIKIRITTNSLSSISIFNSSLHAGNLFFRNNFSLSMFGSAKVDIAALWGGKIDISLYADGIIDINQLIAQTLDVDSWKSGKINIKGIKAERVKAESRYSSLITLQGVCKTTSLSLTNEGIIDSEKLYADPEMKWKLNDSLPGITIPMKDSGKDSSKKQSSKKEREKTSKNGSPVTRP